MVVIQVLSYVPTSDAEIYHGKKGDYAQEVTSNSIAIKKSLRERKMKSDQKKYHYKICLTSKRANEQKRKREKEQKDITNNNEYFLSI
jgi:hypothetical protein